MTNNEINTFAFQLKDGRTCEIKAKYVMKLEKKIINSDGYKIITGEELSTYGSLMEVYIDGIKIDSCWDVTFWDLINVKDYKKIWGVKIGFYNEEIAKAYEAWLEIVKDKGTTIEAKAFMAKEKEKEIKENITLAKDIIERSKHSVRKENGGFMTNEEASIWRKQYNDFQNEGGEGFIPDVVTKEALEWANKYLDQI